VVGRTAEDPLASQHHAGVLPDTESAPASDDDQERRGRLLPPGKGAVPAHRLARRLAAESDESEQRPTQGAGTCWLLLFTDAVVSAAVDETPVFSAKEQSWGTAWRTRSPLSRTTTGSWVTSSACCHWHHWRAAGVDGVDDLGAVDALQVDRGDAEVGVSELALDDDQRDALARAADLMRRYDDHPMDLADATLVALAEYRDDKLIFSLDAHFRSYQLRGRRQLRVIPD
jgi:hypothetical protein